MTVTIQTATAAVTNAAITTVTVTTVKTETTTHNTVATTTVHHAHHTNTVQQAVFLELSIQDSRNFWLKSMIQKRMRQQVHTFTYTLKT